MAEQRTYQGQVYTRNAPGEPWVLSGPAAPAQRGIVIADPYRASEEARRAEDQEIQRAALGVSQQSASTTAANTASDNARADAAAERERLEWEATHFPDGTPRPKADAGAQANPDRVPQIETMLENIRRVREMADDNLAVGGYSGWVGDVPLIGPLLGQNRKNIEGALQMIQGDLIQQQIAILSEMNAGKGVASIANSETEAARMAASVANLSPDQSPEEFLIGLDRAEQYYLRQLDRQKTAAGAAPVGLTAAGSGATTQAKPVPPEMQTENETWLAQNLGTATPQAYAQFRQALDRKYGFDSASEAGLISWFEGAQRGAAQGGDVKTSLPPATEPLRNDDGLFGTSAFSSRSRNNVVSSPVGSFLASMGNAGGFGIPSLMAGDQMEAMRELNSGSSMLGEVAGGITGTMAGGAGLGALASRASNPTVARLLANPMTADMAYGAAYGATQAEDPLYGAFAGAGSAALGNFLGGQIARRAPGVVGLRPAVDPLSRGERAVYTAAGDIDPVVAALSQADELGVPAAMADVAPGVNTLTGAALRRSPDASGAARDTLAQRSRGQYDRFLGAVERDLGPVENIPQRSEDLIAQARATAGPLYDAAYNAAGASSVEMADLVARPSMQRALANARRIALEEGRDPAALGFVLDDAGEVVLTEVPSFQTLDYIKRGLDDVVEGYRDPTTGRLQLDTEGRAVNDTLREFLGRVDAVNPDYAAARAAYAGPAQERGMLARGQEALRMSPNQLGVNANNASPTQLGQMRLGFQSGLAEQAGRGRNNANPFQATLDTPAMEQRLNALQYGGDDIARLLSQRDLEAQLAGSTNRLIGNSATAERQVADQAFGQGGMIGDMATGAVETMLTGAPVVTAARSGIGRTLENSLRDARTLGIGSRATQLADEIAPIALDTDPEAAIQRLLTMAMTDEGYQDLVAALLAQARTRGGHVGAGVSSAMLN